MKAPFVAATLAAVAFLSSRIADANSRYPASNQIVFAGGTSSSSTGSVVVVRTTFGILVSRDSGATWRWLCESALGVPQVSIEDPSVALTANDALVVGLVEGLDVSPDLGCTFNCIGGPLARQPIVDLVVRPDAPHTVLALSSSYVFRDASTPLQDTRVFQSTDDGAHWTELGVPLDPTVVVTTIDVAKSDPQRLYVSGTRNFGSLRTASLFVSTDSGLNWTERPMPFDPATEVSVYIGGVDPTLADRVYVRSSGVSRLSITSDAGQSFQAALTLTGEMLGFAISPDGSKVYAGSVEDGLFVSNGTAADGGRAFGNVSRLQVQCLAAHGSDLWACSDQASGFAIGVSTNDGKQFAPKLQINGLAGPVQCAPSTTGPFACGEDANASQCGGPVFESLCDTLDGCDAGAGTSDPAVSDGMTRDAGIGGGQGSTSSCDFSPSSGGGAAGLAASCAIAAASLRRRSRRRSGHGHERR